MDGSVQFVASCRVCGGQDWLEVVSFGSTPLANGFRSPAEAHRRETTYPLEVGLCRECGLLSLRNQVDPRSLFDHYVYLTSDSRSITEHMTWLVEECRRRVGLSEGELVVEFGSNVGAQLARFQRAGCRTVGVDPARNLAALANRRGVETVVGYFEPAAVGPVISAHGTADLVLGRQTLAHIPDLRGVFAAVDAVLGPEGVLVIEVPYLLDMLDQNQFDTIYHEHASYFSFGTLCRLLAEHGLRAIDVERVAVHGGSIVVFAARDGSSRPGDPSVTDLLALEERRGLRTERPYLEFADRIRRVADTIATMVRELVAQGNRVAGYGAPSKGSALLLACGLDAAEVEFCSDTTELKHGKLLPGSHIPVCSPEQARERAPDVYLLLAWNYADDIIAREHEFLSRGGRFLIPIPEPRIVDVATRSAAVTAAVR